MIELIAVCFIIQVFPVYISWPIVAIIYTGFVYVIVRLARQNAALYSRINRLEFVAFDNFKKDNSMRKEYYKSIMILLLGMFFMLSPIIEVIKVSESTQVQLMKYYFLIIITIFVFYLIQQFKGELVTIIMILSSTLLGFFILIVALISILVMVISIFTIFSPNRVSFYSNYVQMLTTLGMLALYIAKDFVYFWVNLGISILVQFVIITMKPPYMMSRTKFAFKTVSVLFAAVTLITVFFNKEIFQFYMNYSPNLVNDISKQVEFVKFFGSVDILYSQEYFDKAIKGISIPYTLGALLGLYLLDIKENRNSSKANQFFLKGLSAIEQKKSKEEIFVLIRRTMYYGGSAYINIILSSLKFDQYLSDLGYRNSFEMEEAMKLPYKAKKNLSV